VTESEGPTPTVLSRQIDEAAAVMFREGPGEEAASGEGAPAVAVDPEGAPAVAVNPEAAVDQPEEDRPPPRGYDAAFRCPLCGELMTDPVILISSGESFERAALSQALKERPGQCPKTGAEFRGAPKLAPNNTLKRAVDAWRAHLKRPRDDASRDESPPRPPPEAPRRCSTCNKSNVAFSKKDDGTVPRPRGRFLPRQGTPVSRGDAAAGSPCRWVGGDATARRPCRWVGGEAAARRPCRWVGGKAAARRPGGRVAARPRRDETRGDAAARRRRGDDPADGSR